MSDKIKRIPTQMFIGAYQGEETAGSLERLVTDEEFDSAGIICTNMAVASRDIAGKTHIRELGNPAAMEEAVSSAMLGGLLGSMSRLMIGSDDVVARAAKQIQKSPSADKPGRRSSALIKAATKEVMPGMDKDRLAKLGAALKPGSSVIVLIFDEVLVKQSDYESKMQGHQDGTDAIAEVVITKIQENLAKGSDIAFHITFENGQISATRTIQGPDAIQVRDIVLSQDSLAVEQVTATDKSLATNTLLVTPDAVATARTLLTSSLVAYEVSLENEDGFIYEKGAVHEKETENSYELSASKETGIVTSDTIVYEKESKSVKTEFLEG